MTAAANQAGAQNNTDGAGGGNAGGDATALGGAQNNQAGNNGGNANQGGGDGSGSGAGGGAAVQVFDPTKITLPEGWKIDDALMKDFLPVATDAKLSQEAAQKLVDLQVKGMQGLQQAFQQQQDDAYVKQHKDWTESLRTDKVVGGADMQKNIGIAMKAIAKFGDPELTALFQHYDKDKNPTGMGFGDIPALVRFAFKIGQTISEDSFGNQGGNNNTAAKSAEMLLYGPGTEVKSGVG